jgi:hypothetical protein
MAVIEMTGRANAEDIKAKVTSKVVRLSEFFMVFSSFSPE